MSVEELIADAQSEITASRDARPQEPGLGDVLADVMRFVRRYVVLSDPQLVALALWVLHTHAFAAAETTPYIAITSAEKRSGKSRLQEVLELLVRSPLPSVNTSDAALFRAIDPRRADDEAPGLPPTVLFDEIDAIFGPKARDREDLRGMLNAGFRRGAVTLRMGGANNTTLQTFSVFCPKAFAGIGELPDTIRDRSIRIRLERKTPDEVVERLRRRDASAHAETLREQLAVVAANCEDVLADARPALPDELDDRAQDIWEPLLAIADLAAGEWPHRARSAAVALSSGTEREDESPGAKLLRDVQTVFESSGAQAFKTNDLIAELALIEESPWGDWKGKVITAHAISGLLRPYRIKTMPVWIDGQTVRGYKVEQFYDAWLRVVGVRSVREVRSGFQSQNGLTDPNAPNAEALGGVRTNPSNAPNAPNAPNAQGRADGFVPISDEDLAELAVTAGEQLSNAEVRRLLERYRPDLVGREDILTREERRSIANTYALYEKAYGPPESAEVS